LLAGVLEAPIQRWARSLGAVPHVAGTPGQAATRDSVLAWLDRPGIEVSSDTFLVYLPHPVSVSVEMTAPTSLSLYALEPELEVDPITGTEPVPAFNAYGAAGTVEGPVVYANYGLPRDYRALDSLGVSVRGRIVIARYGRSFRGIKAREAQTRGAVGLILYSDPAEDGHRRGDVYPEGPMRPPTGIQRGSIFNGTGDPSTPGRPSVPGVDRLRESEMTGVARIPVVPLAYGSASELLGRLQGPAAPGAFQGALPFFYHLGPGPARARIRVQLEEGRAAYHDIFNTIAVVRGSEWPDEWIVVGGHRDAWGPGAVDNVSGTVSVIAAARAFADLAARGARPRRSVLFATWDAEEWGLIGSTEWVERHVDSLREGGIAYLNQDVSASGPNFGASAAPPLKALIRDAAAAVTDPGGRGSVLDAWKSRSIGATEDRPAPVGDLGGGSDHKPFYQHVGVPAASFGFGGPGGVYHSAYDTYTWMERFGDPGYRYHSAAARIVAITAARLANADLHPYDFVGASAQLADMVGEVRYEIESTVQVTESIETRIVALEGAASRFRAEARRYHASADALLAGGGNAQPLDEANLRLRGVNLAFLSPMGLADDAWTKQQLFVSDPANGYATLGFPGVRLVLREIETDGVGETDELGERLRDLTDRLEAASVEIIAAREALD
jgi:N-acetylated-alpha-linked acidic dipeptidase